MAFYDGVASRHACPTFTHRIEYTGTDAAHITVGNFSSDYPKTVKMYHATTTDGERRDWRLFNCVHDCPVRSKPQALRKPCCFCSALLCSCQSREVYLEGFI